MSLTTERYHKNEGIISFLDETSPDHSDYKEAGLHSLSASETNHFWFICRKEYILKAFQRYLSTSCTILEVGAGTAYVAKGLIETGYNVAVGEYHLAGLQYARRKGISKCYQFDLFIPPFRDKYDAIGMFDVVEHLQDDVLALKQTAKMLKPGGLMFITTPAHNWLWSQNDSLSGHKRRYTKKTMHKLLDKAGLQVIYIRYFFIFILPLLLLRRIVNRDSGKNVKPIARTEKITINSFVNFMLLWVTRFENKITKWIPNIAGGSLLVVAKKQ